MLMRRTRRVSDLELRTGTRIEPRRKQENSGGRCSNDVEQTRVASQSIAGQGGKDKQNASIRYLHRARPRIESPPYPCFSTASLSSRSFSADAGAQWLKACPKIPSTKLFQNRAGYSARSCTLMFAVILRLLSTRDRQIC